MQLLDHRRCLNYDDKRRRSHAFQGLFVLQNFSISSCEGQMIDGS